MTRRVWVIEFKHSLGWTPLETRVRRDEAWQRAREWRERSRQHGRKDKFRTVPYDAADTGKEQGR